MTTMPGAAPCLLTQLRLSVSAELAKGCSEQRLLHACNEAVAERCQQLGGGAAAATRQLEELWQQHGKQVAPQLRALGMLEAQVCESIVRAHVGRCGLEAGG